MGLDLSVYTIDKYKDIEFITLYTQISDELLQKANKGIEADKLSKLKYIDVERTNSLERLKRNKRSEEVISEWISLTNEMDEERKKQINKKYDSLFERFKTLNDKYNRLSEEEKLAISNIEPRKFKYYGKNRDLFRALDHQLGEAVFDHELQEPLRNLEKEHLIIVCKELQKKDPKNNAISYLHQIIDKIDFESKYVFIEAWY